MPTNGRGRMASNEDAHEARTKELQSRLNQFYAAVGSPEAARTDTAKIAQHFVNNLPALNAKLIEKYGQALDNIVLEDANTDVRRLEENLVCGELQTASADQAWLSDVGSGHESEDCASNRSSAHEGRTKELQNRLNQFYAAVGSPEAARSDSAKIAQHFVNNLPALNAKLAEKYGQTLDDVVPLVRRLIYMHAPCTHAFEYSHTYSVHEI